MESTLGVRGINVAMIMALCAAAAFSNQDPTELDSTARTRIEQASASILLIEAVNQSNQTISRALGFYIRKDLVATDSEMVDRNSRLHLTTATQKRMIKALSSGNYF